MASQFELEQELNARTEQADVDQYTEWLLGYIENGGVPDYVRGHTMGERLEVVTDDAPVPRLTGANLRELIVPEDVTVTFDDLGHNDIYYMDGFETDGRPLVYIYAEQIDIVREKHPEIFDEIESVEWQVQATCADDECAWESEPTDDETELLGESSEHSHDTGHGVIHREVLVEDDQDRDRDVLVTRRYTPEE